MSDDEIRDLLDLGVQEPAGGDALSAEQLWSAGRRQRNRGRAWLGGLGAAAAAASLLGIVWAQGLAGGDAAPPPSDETPDTMPSPSPTVDGGEDARGEPFFARFESADSEPAAQLSGASRPATLEDLQGTWHGPFGELFGFDGDTFTVDTGAPCHEGGSQQVEVSPEGRLLVADGIAWEQVDCSADDEGRVGWRYALQQEPLLSMDGGTLIISGLDGTSDDPRVPVALTLASSEPFDSPSVWRDTSAQTGVSPIELGEDVRPGVAHPARAGVHGKGFAVVAEEVRSLAARSASAAKETTELIEGTIGKTEAGARIAGDMAAALDSIVASVEKSAQLVSEIAAASNEQATAIAQVNRGIEQLSAVVQTNSATSEEAAAAAEELSGQAEILKSMVEQFRLRESMGKPARPAALKEAKKEAPPAKAQIDLSDSDFGKY